MPPNFIKRMPRKYGLVIFTVGLICVGFFIALTLGHPNNKIVTIEPQYAANYTDDKILMGASHNVFIAKVISRIGMDFRGALPETQFSVKIISNVKGNLHGIITVNQVGGYKNGTLYVVSDSDLLYKTVSGNGGYFLQPNATYLLATRYNSNRDWYTVNSFPTASKLITANGNLNDFQLEVLAENDSRVQELAAAYPKETLLQTDILNGNTRNSYQSLHPAQVMAPTSTTGPIVHIPAIPSSAATSSSNATTSSYSSGS